MTSAFEPVDPSVVPVAREVSEAEAWPLVERRPARPVPRRLDEPPPPSTSQVSHSGPPPLAPFRWVAIAVGLVVASQTLRPSSYSLIFGAIVLVAYAAYRTIRPIPYADDGTTTAQILVEMALHTVIVLWTGAWFSPYTFCLLPSAMLAGFARGSAFALRVTMSAALLISIDEIVFKADNVPDGLRDSAAWLVVLGLVAVASGVARQVTKESARQHSLALDRLGRLAEANALLFSLHRVAQTLPASLDLDDVLDSSITRLRDLVDFDSVTVLLYEESDQSWVPIRRKGNPAQETLDTEGLPPPLQRAMHGRGALREADLATSDGPGLAPLALSGMYSSLRARGSLIGLIAVEHSVANQFGPKEVELLNGLVEPLGVAIDNARWFSRLRSIGADEERSRIARDIHDQIGQSLASLGFELDRAVKQTQRSKFQPMLVDIRDQVRSVVQEVRETLFDLRTDVSDSQDLGTTMELFCDRLRERSGIHIEVDREETGRLPLLQERELWRIGKEAVINVERHARASKLVIRWHCDGERAELVVIDDGVGFNRRAGRQDSYGMVGMRERATTIGARLEIRSTPGQGTTVRVTLAPEQGART
jgi:signal transduction histidine kinase